MKNKLICLYILILPFFVLGCETSRKIVSAPVRVSKFFWGSSTTSLEKARQRGRHKRYDCEYSQCFDAVLTLAKSFRDRKISDKSFELFSKNRKKRMIVVIGIEGVTDTTEVGIFFVPIKQGQVKVEIASKSSQARDIVAGIVFDRLKDSYQEVK